MDVEDRYWAWVASLPRLPRALVVGLGFAGAMSPLFLLFVATGGPLRVGLMMLGAGTLAVIVFGYWVWDEPPASDAGSGGLAGGEQAIVGDGAGAGSEPGGAAGEGAVSAERGWSESAWPRPVAWWLRAFPPLVGAAVDAVVFAGPLLPVVVRGPPGRAVPAYLLAVALLGWSSYGARVRARRPGGDGGGGVSSGARGAGRRG